jgi:predicted transposase YbfD/YdcC
MHHRVQKKKKAGRSSKVVPKGMQSTTKLQEVVPKGAQRKFSPQKSFLRECRAKYRRNIRRRSSKDAPKEMQNLHRKVNGDTAEIEGEEVQKTFLRGCRTYTEK